jgi:uncharacterized protein
MAVQFSVTQRAVTVGVASAGLLIAAAGTARITVTGTGKVSGVPNQLSLSIGVQTSAGSVASALRQANTAARSVTAVLRRSGVATADIQTSGLSIYPSYSNSSGAPSSYQVSEQLTVTLRRLSVAGSQISAAARAGGNATTIDGVSLNLSDTSTLLASAREQAVADAEAKAAAYAHALGRPLGPVVTMSEVAPAQPFQPQPELAVPAPGRAATVPVHPGTQQLSVTVTVVFALG